MMSTNEEGGIKNLISWAVVRVKREIAVLFLVESKRDLLSIYEP